MSMDSSTKARDQDEAQATLCDEAVYKSYSDINSDLHTSNKPRLNSYIPRSRLHRFLVIPFILSLLLIPLVYVISINTRTSYKQCGTTADEARARGCVFETTGFTWLPKECHDQDTEEEFLEFITSHKINLYRDTNMTDIVTVEEVREGNGPGFWVKQQYHNTHCLFLLKKLHRTMASGKIVDGQIMPTHHTEHCVEMVLKGPEFRKNAAQLSYTKFPYCGKPGGFNVGWKRGIGPLGWTDY